MDEITATTEQPTYVTMVSDLQLIGAIGTIPVFHDAPFTIIIHHGGTEDTECYIYFLVFCFYVVNDDNNILLDIIPLNDYLPAGKTWAGAMRNKFFYATLLSEIVSNGCISSGRWKILKQPTDTIYFLLIIWPSSIVRRF